MNKLRFGILVSALCLLGACDSGSDASKDKAGKQAKADKGGKDKAGKASADAGKDKAGKDAGKGEPAGKDATNAAAAEGGEDGEEEATPEQIVAALDKRVRRAAKLAREIETTPDKASEILEVAGLDRDAFEALIYEIGADPDLAQQYQVAMAQAPI